MNDHTTIPEGHKRCTQCNAVLPATREYFHACGEHGLKSACKTCRCEKSRLYHQANLERVHEKSREWRQAHRDYVREKNQQYAEKYPERIAEYNRRYREKHHARVRSNFKKWRENHLEIARERSRAGANKRRAQKLNSTTHFTPEDISVQLEAQNGRCWWCGCQLKNGYHADHRIPLSRGGSNAPENIVLTCPRCNISKGARLPSEWNGRLL